MRDAIGGSLIIQLIIVFLLIINGYLAFTVNYTKAFRIKNDIISIIERNEGLNQQAAKEINSLMARNAYAVSKEFINKCSSMGGGYLSSTASRFAGDMLDGGFCFKVTLVGEDIHNNQPVYKGVEYSIITFVNVDIPVLNKVLPLFANAFVVKGETKTIYSSGNNVEIGVQP